MEAECRVFHFLEQPHGVHCHDLMEACILLFTLLDGCPYASLVEVCIASRSILASWKSASHILCNNLVKAFIMYMKAYPM